MPRLHLAVILPLSLMIAGCEPTAAPPATPSDPAEFAFMGSWDCGVSVLTFLSDGYMPSNDDAPIPVTAFKILQNGGTEITLKGGDRMVVQDVTDQRMNWLSMQTGDSFDCTRVAG